MTTELQQRIVERIRREGPLPFADYMRIALYEPGYGYYVTGAPKMGWQGDYFTSADVFDLFAHCIGQQLLQMWEALRRPAPFVVLEQGAGRATLVDGVQAWAKRDAPDLLAALDYRVEDIRLGLDARAARWEDEDEDEDRGDRPSVMLSNELVDAFPVHLVEVRDGRLHEVYVDEQVGEVGQLCEVLDELSSPELADYLDHFRIPWRTFAAGWRAEINLDAPRWMEQCAKALKRGFLLTIDYGEKARNLYTRDRQRGTLLCYSQHRANERPLLHPGAQDITAHVNFDALIEEGRRHGLRRHAYLTQRQWLERMGLSAELERRYNQQFAPALAKRGSDQGQIALLQWRALHAGAALLANPSGMGNFKVLVMRR